MPAEQPLGEHTLRAAHTYGAAADHYGLDSLSFWDSFGATTVARLRLPAGATVLDLCCGGGASAIPAAHAVGAGGRVLGVDVAAPLLEMARARASCGRAASPSCGRTWCSGRLSGGTSLDLSPAVNVGVIRCWCAGGP